jgi:hypothetical protein
VIPVIEYRYHYVISDYCISITRKSDRSITVIYHAMTDYYCISITKKSDTSITVIYHAMSLTTVSVSPRRVICLFNHCDSPITLPSDTDTVVRHKSDKSL